MRNPMDVDLSPSPNIQMVGHHEPPTTIASIQMPLQKVFVTKLYHAFSSSSSFPIAFHHHPPPTPPPSHSKMLIHYLLQYNIAYDLFITAHTGSTEPFWLSGFSFAGVANNIAHPPIQPPVGGPNRRSKPRGSEFLKCHFGRQAEGDRQMLAQIK